MRSLKSIYTIPAHKSAVSDLQFFRTNASALPSTVPKGMSGLPVFVGKDERAMDIEDAPVDVPLSGSFLVSSGYDGYVKVWSADDWQLVKAMTSDAGGKVMSVDVSSGQCHLLSSFCETSSIDTVHFPQMQGFSLRQNTVGRIKSGQRQMLTCRKRIYRVADAFLSTSMLQACPVVESSRSRAAASLLLLLPADKHLSTPHSSRAYRASSLYYESRLHIATRCRGAPLDPESLSSHQSKSTTSAFPSPLLGGLCLLLFLQFKVVVVTLDDWIEAVAKSEGATRGARERQIQEKPRVRWARVSRCRHAMQVDITCDSPLGMWTRYLLAQIAGQPSGWSSQ